ncbi:MAG: DUF4912 domain-containing protein [Chitinivibrionales bacterium]|nr:DUF4912 domain-containing protein [Chitinivibrionales bacterium]
MEEVMVGPASKKAKKKGGTAKKRSSSKATSAKKKTTSAKKAVKKSAAAKAVTKKVSVSKKAPAAKSESSRTPASKKASAATKKRSLAKESTAKKGTTGIAASKKTVTKKTATRGKKTAKKTTQKTATAKASVSPAKRGKKSAVKKPRSAPSATKSRKKAVSAKVPASRKRVTVRTTAGRSRTPRPSPGKQPVLQPDVRYDTSGIQAPELQGPRYTFGDDIPQVYNKDYMRALPRDPEWVYVYWEITARLAESIRNRMGDHLYHQSTRILRMLDVTDIEFSGANAWRCIDTEINPYANNWYVKAPESGRAYLVQAGHLAPDGTFYEMLRSNTVAVPRAGVSDKTDEEWQTVNTDELIRLSGQAYGKGQLADSSSSDFGRLFGSEMSSSDFVQYLGSGADNL